MMTDSLHIVVKAFLLQEANLNKQSIRLPLRFTSNESRNSIESHNQSVQC